MFDSLMAIMLAQSAVVADRPPASDAALATLATRESLLPERLGKTVTDDPSLRAEIRRVGFARGCRAMAASRAEVAGRYRSALVPATILAIRTKVPASALNNARILSFMAMPLVIYRSRIDDELGRVAGEKLSRASEDMKRTFLKVTRAYPNASDPKDNIVAPRPDIAAALGINGAYDLDSPTQLALACAELLVAPGDRPTITTGPAPTYTLAVP